MNLIELNIHGSLVPSNYLQLAQAALKSKKTAANELVEKRKLPDHGWSDDQIEEIVHQLSSLDSNNFPNKAGLGEREARIASRLVARRHYNFGHGIGRSGDLLEAQPKAAGSTLLANLTNSLLLDLLHYMGIKCCCSCFLVPLATGMTLILCMLAFRKQRPRANYVLWSRIDQKSCFKSITSAGLVPIIIDTKSQGEEGLSTDVEAFKHVLQNKNTEEILCIFSTTSCFAPRNCDDIVELAKLAKSYGVPHLVNNAYGLQTTYLTHQLQQAQRLGRIDLFVQSTDKNLMVPVGGAIVSGFDEQLVKDVAKSYAGRASSSQTLDVFITLLSFGKIGYLGRVQERKQNFKYLRSKLIQFAEQHGTRVYNSKRNPISLALSLEPLSCGSENNLTQFGSMLYTRGVSGVRVVTDGQNNTIDGHTFTNWGTHHSTSPQEPYLTVAASLGVTLAEIDMFILKLGKCWQAYSKDNNKKLLNSQKMQQI